MAGTLRLLAGIAVDNGNFQYSSDLNSVDLTQTNVGGPFPGIITAVAAGQGTLLDFVTNGLTSPGWFKITNLDDTIDVDFGKNNAGNIDPILTIPAKSFQLAYVKTGITYRLRAVSGTSVKLKVEGFER